MLQKSVLATLAYYDVLNYPLTSFEVWKHLLISDGEAGSEPVSLATILSVLDALRREGRIHTQHGFWFLPHCESLVSERIHKEKRAVPKLKRAARLARWCSFIPYVRMIALTGSLSMKQGERGSDWDFFVVMRQGGIWTGRFLLTLWLTLLGQRRHADKVADRACLNYYLADGNLAIPLQDVFSSHEYRFLYPVVGPDTFRVFELANRWMLRYRPNFLPTVAAPWFLRRPSHLALRLQKIFESIIPLSLIEPWLARFQKRMIEKNPKTHLAGGYITATDEALIFLPEPKGPRVFEAFKKRLSEV